MCFRSFERQRFFPQFLPYFFGERTEDNFLLASLDLPSRFYFYGYMYFLSVPFQGALETRFGGQEVMLCARWEKQYFAGEFIFPVQAFLHFQVTQCKSDVKRTQMCQYRQKWRLSNNLQRNHTRFISSKQVYSPNSRLSIHSIWDPFNVFETIYPRAKFRMDRNWTLVILIKRRRFYQTLYHFVFHCKDIRDVKEKLGLSFWKWDGYFMTYPSSNG